MSNLAADKHGTIVGHIAARAPHQSLLQVAVTEDCRFAFAGVLRGSAQMLALDLSHLPTWSNYDRKSKLAVMRHVGVYAHQDAKLKGFGAVTRLLEGGGTNFAEYRLICGRGIKNMHIWSVAMAHEGSEPTWTLLYDAPTNGMTIELIGFRNFGTVAFSRSKGYGLRPGTPRSKRAPTPSATSGEPSSSRYLAPRPPTAAHHRSRDRRFSTGGGGGTRRRPHHPSHKHRRRGRVRRRPRAAGRRERREQQQQQQWQQQQWRRGARLSSAAAVADGSSARRHRLAAGGGTTDATKAPAAGANGAANLAASALTRRPRKSSR